MFEEFFSKAFGSVDEKVLSVLKIQTVLLLLLLNGFADFFYEGSLVILQIIFTLVYLFFLFQGFKKEFKDERIVFLALFFGLLIVAEAVFAFDFFKINFFTNPQIVLGVIFLVIAIFVVYSFLLNKKTLVGEVVFSEGDKAVVKTSFSLGSFIAPGEYFVQAGKKFKKGQKVKVEVKQTLFGKKPSKIIGSL